MIPKLVLKALSAAASNPEVRRRLAAAVQNPEVRRQVKEVADQGIGAVRRWWSERESRRSETVIETPAPKNVSEKTGTPKAKPGTARVARKNT